ncbi:hypothetical protein ACLX1H_008941 [Fusarium chlamydosporum]
MPARLLRSLFFASALSPIALAGPCRPSSIVASISTETLTSTDSLSTIVSSSAISIGTEIASHSNTISEDAVATVESSSTISADTSSSPTDSSFGLPTDTSITLDNTISEGSTTSTEALYTASSIETESSFALFTDTTITASETATSSSTTLDDVTTTTTEASSVTTEATSTAPACTPTLLSSRPADLECGKEGNPVSLSRPNIIRELAGDSAPADAATCNEVCLETPECKSIIFVEGLGCVLLSIKVGQTSDEEAPFLWYDTACFSTCKAENPQQPEPEPSCKNNLKNPLPDNKACGKRGDSGGGVQAMGDGVSGSLDDCHNSCLETTNCESFLWQENSHCVLYSGHPVSRDETGQDYGEWYELGCFCEAEVTEPEPSCKNHLKNPLPDLVCGQAGIPENADLYLDGFGPYDTLQHCAAACKGSSLCTAFSFEAEDQCRMFSGTLSPTDATPTSFKWYDIDCFCEL